MSDARLCLIAFDQPVERLAVDEIQDLSQHNTAGIHARKMAFSGKCVTLIFRYNTFISGGFRKAFDPLTGHP
jgi:hypothetical protein